MQNVTIITGPMFAGKTSQMIELIRKFEKDHPDLNKIVIKPKSDDRYDADCIVSHNKSIYPALNAESLMEMVPAIEKLQIQYCFIDEGHFFPDIPKFLKHHYIQSIHVFIAGLDYDYKKDPFEGMKMAIDSYASTIMQLRAQCIKCKGLATYTARYDSDDKTLIRIGGTNTYFACCEACHPHTINIRYTPESPRKNKE